MVSVTPAATMRQVLPRQSEKAFMAQVVKLAEMQRWAVYHPWRSDHSAAGWPDLVLCRPPRLLIVELKSDVGSATLAQEWWLKALARCGVQTATWRPKDWPEIVRVLSGIGDWSVPVERDVRRLDVVIEEGEG